MHVVSCPHIIHTPAFSKLTFLVRRLINQRVKELGHTTDADARFARVYSRVMWVALIAKSQVWLIYAIQGATLKNDMVMEDWENCNDGLHL